MGKFSRGVGVVYSPLRDVSGRDRMVVEDSQVYLTAVLRASHFTGGF